MEIKRCPFSGAEAESAVREHTFADYPDEYTYAVYCTNCNVEIESDESEEDAIQQWNRRAIVPVVEEVSNTQEAPSIMSDTVETKVVTTDDKDILAAARCLLAGGSDLHCPDCVFRAGRDENVFACKQKLFASLQQYIENTNEKCRQFYSSKVVEFPVELHDTIYDSDGQACEVTDLIYSITGDICFVAKKSDKHSDTFYAKDRGKVWFASIADYDKFKSAKPSRVEMKVESLSGKIWREYIDALGTTYLREGEIKQIIPRGEGIGDYEVVAYFPATIDHLEDSVTAPLSTFILTREDAVKSLLEEK